MKSPLSTLALCAALCLPACQTAPTPIVRATVSAAASYAIAKQKTPEKRTAAAQKIMLGASAVLAVTSPTATGGDLTELILAQTGRDDADLVALATAAGLAFAIWRESNPDTDISAGLRPIAEDLVRVAMPYLADPS